MSQNLFFLEKKRKKKEVCNASIFSLIFLILQSPEFLGLFALNFLDYLQHYPGAGYRVCVYVYVYVYLSLRAKTHPLYLFGFALSPLLSKSGRAEQRAESRETPLTKAHIPKKR